MGKRIETFRPTTDRWHPNFPDDQVRVSLLPIGPKGKNGWRVCVWGADDDGMEIDFAARVDAKTIFDKVIRWSTITKAKLEGLGFVPA